MPLRQPPRTPDGPPIETHRWLGPAIAATAALAIYLNSLGNGFALDDVIVVSNNSRLHTLAGAWELLLTPYWPGPDALDRGLYRPLTSLAFALQWSLGEGSPLPFHILNTLLHAAVSGLLYVLLRALMGWRGALAGSLVYAVHPVHTEAVANVVGQAELWSGLVVLAAAVAYVRRGPGGLSVRRGGLIAILYVVALLFKEHAIVLPALLLLLDVGTRRLGDPMERERWIPFGVLLAAVAAQYLTLRWIILDGSLSGRAAMDLPFLAVPRTRVLTALSVWPEYARLLFFPRDLSAVYDPATLLPQEAVSAPVVVGAALLTLGVGAALLPRFWPAWGLGFAWFFVTILPVSNLLLPVGTLLGERTLYLPSLAVGFWVGFATERVWEHATTRVRRVGLATALLLVLGACSWTVVHRNPVWRDNASLFEVTVRDHPENFRAHWFRALGAAEEGDTLASADSWRRARSIYGSNSTFLTQYADFQRRRARSSEATELVDEALRLRPTSASALLLRGLLHLDDGDTIGARKQVDALVELGFPGMASALADSLSAAAWDRREDSP